MYSRVYMINKYICINHIGTLSIATQKLVCRRNLRVFLTSFDHFCLIDCKGKACWARKAVLRRTIWREPQTTSIQPWPWRFRYSWISWRIQKDEKEDLKIWRKKEERKEEEKEKDSGQKARSACRALVRIRPERKIVSTLL